ncbi:adenylate/guanylate cyclase domain-containing protein [Chryseosolibacter indicus]|uniref:Adenylate/guanylate cyclase domain-containing protein n=1 Tax=Chryseosolibacter indicus TaxID=2782351 RepID=A0ABS5VT94_9BACT|nr:adenylate/guanylate cyclase domain-containing protein [Chryseosolibacter indicus]MBT1704099.1 adenylate/guanylate cyclase domain-containing protein [Chryseosolibacter indicus]
MNDEGFSRIGMSAANFKSAMHNVEFEGDEVVTIQTGESLLEASLRAGIQHLHVCGGKGKCSTCRVLILEGHSNLSAPNNKEKQLNKKLSFLPDIRLACQTTVQVGTVKLKRIIRDDSDIGYYVGKDAVQTPQQIGEELEMVLLFFDIRNFTTFSEAHFPFDVIHVIRKLFSVFQTILESHGGKIIELMGDGFYAVFQCESDIHAAVRDAVQAGLSILEKLNSLNESYFKPHFMHIIQAGIGVHVGKVISGEIELNSISHRFVMGSPVNIASRLQNATKELNNSFIISSEVHNHLPASMQSNRSAFVNLKGVNGDVRVFLMGTPYNP